MMGQMNQMAEMMNQMNQMAQQMPTGQMNPMGQGGNGRPRPQMRPGDWICAGCSNHNFASRDNCNRCQAPRTEGESVSSFGPAPSGHARPSSSPYGGASQQVKLPASGEPPAMKEGDWMCPLCGNHNFASRVNCNKCKAVREGMKEGDWVCRGCKTHNFASRQNCNSCQAPRLPEQQKGGGKGCGNNMMMNSMGGGNMAMNPQAMMQQMMQMMMQMAGGGKGMGNMGGNMGGKMNMMGGGNMTPSGKPMKNGDWLCPSCGNHNFASRATCNKCPQVRPGFKDGDWVCRACKNHNFASRTECNKCQAPKDAM